METPWVIAWAFIAFFFTMMIYFRDRAHRAENEKKYWREKHSNLWIKYKQECKIK